jgi:hypothetical protein
MWLLLFFIRMVGLIGSDQSAGGTPQGFKRKANLNVKTVWGGALC